MPKQTASAKTTTNHDTIRRWVEQRGGCPATVKSTRGKNDPGVIRIDYTGYSGKDTLEPISWREFFKAFEQNQLAFLYQERTASGRPSRFSKLVRRNARSKSASKKNGASKARSSSRSSSRRVGAKVTTDHDVIRRWVEARGGCPAAVKKTRSSEDPGIIRIDYTGFSGKDSLEKISWREFFDAFEQNELAFLYQERTASGRPSRFSKLIDRSSAQSGRQRSRSTKRGAARRGKSNARRARPRTGNRRPARGGRRTSARSA